MLAFCEETIPPIFNQRQELDCDTDKTSSLPYTPLSHISITHLYRTHLHHTHISTTHTSTQSPLHINIQSLPHNGRLPAPHEREHIR